MGSRARRRGLDFERRIAKRLQHIFPDAARKLDEPREGGGVDLEGTGRLRIQCKRWKKYAPVNKILEVQLQDEGEIPILVTGEKGGHSRDDMAVLRFDDLIHLLEMVYLGGTIIEHE